MGTVYVDLVGPVAVKSKRKYLLTIMDAFTKYADAVPIKSKRAREVAEALTTSLTGVYGGTPLNIVADRGMEFVGRATRTAMNMLGHNLTFLPADLHQSNLVERFHCTLMSMIRSIRTEGVQDWVPAVRMAVQYYNHKEHASTGHAPVELHLGIDPRHPGILAPPGQEAAPLNYADMDEYNKQQAQIAKWGRGKLMIRQAEQAREVARYYQHKNLSLQPGSLVWLNKRATNHLDGDLLISRKLALQWSGPFIYLRTVNDCLGEIARQEKGQQTGRPIRVHLSKLWLYRDLESYPG